MALRTYLHFLNSYNATYGSLGAEIILLISLYLTEIATLIGGEVNVVIEEALVQNRETEISDHRLAKSRHPPHYRPAAKGNCS